jgi:hypothetical protein
MTVVEYRRVALMPGPYAFETLTGMMTILPLTGSGCHPQQRHDVRAIF